MTKKLLLVLLLSTKMYGMWWGYRALEDGEEFARKECEKRGRMDWWAPQNEVEQKGKALKCEKDTEEKNQKSAQNSTDSLDQATMNKLLHATAAAGKTDAVQHLLKIGAPINGRDEDGWTPLMQAAKGKHLAIVKMLLDAGADPDLYSDYCKVCDAASWSGDYPPGWHGPRERIAPPPHKCRQVTSAPEIAKSGRLIEIENLLEKYKTRSTKN